LQHLPATICQRFCGNDCATCHPTYDTLGSWDGGCQQGGCHFTYHQDSTKAHLPFDDGNYCTHCHDDSSWNVTQSMCLNCHAANAPNDITPPETFCDAQSQYVGPAKISFSIVDDGMVGVGRTFYRLDLGPATARQNIIRPRNTHPPVLSMDQAGNTEAHQDSSVHRHSGLRPTTTNLTSRRLQQAR
jgi:hypothetical protein